MPIETPTPETRLTKTQIIIEHLRDNGYTVIEGSPILIVKDTDDHAPVDTYPDAPQEETEVRE